MSLILEKGDVYDVVGIGLGPANLALAVALEDEAAKRDGSNLRRLFLDAKPSAAWHPGMLLEGSVLQVSVLKDLATLRNPCSPFTFLNYLKNKGRLLEFLNLRDLYPTRVEFNDYLVWVAQQLHERVSHGCEVMAIDPVRVEGKIKAVRVTYHDGKTGEAAYRLARNVVLATGGVPSVPDGIQLRPGGRAFHSSQTLQRLKADYPDANAPYRFVVVGGGQSGAELFHYLMTRYPNAEVTATIRGLSYKPIDDSHFSNEIFHPEMVSYIYDLPESVRRRVLGHCKDVNYGVVSADLIRRVYNTLYQEKVAGRNRARIRGFLELEQLLETDDVVMTRFRDLTTNELVTMKADGVIMCTGYEWRLEHPLLRELSPWIEREENGNYKVERNYRVTTEPAFEAGIFLQGFAEATHGVTETVLSLLSVRAGDIVQSILDSQSHAEHLNSANYAYGHTRH
ncbi:lysine N(6)-hydroxylase/L-ornithine N(5)-oxygenase family protein [Pendulispora brunnea]|uniref:Lysine N(6)-hydroxylase/L-ornithine N(5)-oxygenase family protein n=1 Tax=Pendulispora brunnea TaxID=2905690 RepID=A0ABZ2KKR5_9BACT